MFFFKLNTIKNKQDDSSWVYPEVSVCLEKEGSWEEGPEHLLPGTTGSEVVRELSGLDVVAVVPILGEAPLLQKVTLPDRNYSIHKKCSLF